MLNQLTPDEESDLRWLEDGSASALGVRSWLGPMGDKMRAGTIRCQSSPGEGRDLGADAERLGRIRRRLDEAEVASPGSARVLLAYYGPPKSDVLPTFGQDGLVMALLSKKEPTQLNQDARKASKRDAGATARLEALRAKAEVALDRARGAYAQTRAPRKTDDATVQRRAEAGRRKEADRRGHYAGRTDGNRAVVYATASARRMGGAR